MTQADMHSEKSETIEVEDLDQFVTMLVAWHTNKVQVLEHLLEIPEGSEMTLTTKGVDDTVLSLKGDVLAGFQAGLQTALLELGKLPFGYEAEPEVAPEENLAEATG